MGPTTDRNTEVLLDRERRSFCLWLAVPCCVLATPNSLENKLPHKLAVPRSSVLLRT